MRHFVIRISYLLCQIVLASFNLTYKVYITVLYVHWIQFFPQEFDEYIECSSKRLFYSAKVALTQVKSILGFEG